MKAGCYYKSDTLESMNLFEYLKGRNLKLLAILMGLSGKALYPNEEKLTQLVVIVECIYHLVTSVIMPFNFMMNLFIYKKHGSKMLANLYGTLLGGGHYDYINLWLDNYSNNKKL